MQQRGSEALHRDMLGAIPCVVAGDGPPLVVLQGLMPFAGVGSGDTISAVHRSSIVPWARTRTVHYTNRRPGMPAEITLAQIAAEHADGIRDRFGGAVDVLGMSTGGSIAQQLAADHPDVVRRLMLLSTGCRLPDATRRAQRQIGVRIRHRAVRQASALMAHELSPRGLGLALALTGWLVGPFVLDLDGLDDMAATIFAEDTFELAALAPITAPTLIINGGRDRFYPIDVIEETAALIAGSRLDVQPDKGHIGVVSSDHTIALVNAFLDEDRAFS
jgi:pimeloyl-ACP methyl ester carboxylesterase